MALSVAILAAIGLGTAEAQCLRYTLQTIQAPNCGILLRRISPQRIADNGLICGYRSNCNDDDRPFWWDGASVITLALPAPYVDGRASALNSAGQIVGWRGYIGTPDRPFVYTNGQIADLPFLPGANTGQALSISETGVIAGYSQNSFTGSPPLTAVLWENGSVTALNLPPNFDSVAFDVNDSNQVVGHIRFVNEWPWPKEPFLWDNGQTTLFPIPKGTTRAEAVALNNRTHVLGWYLLGEPGPDAVLRLFFWAEGKMVEIGSPNCPPPSMSVGGINDIGQIVGADCEGPFVWQNGVRRLLQNLIPANTGFVLHDAMGINNHGQITGKGNFPGSGHDVAYILTPLPPKVGDVNCDWIVNRFDILDVVAAWGPCPNPPPPFGSCNADLNSDGVINVTDLLIVINNWTG